jgi:predicted AlkP superfamily phosphohydrolase/phosphomutase
MNKVLVIGLDGYEISVGDQLMAAGEMPTLAKIREQSARFLLQHGAAKRTGLAWEHFSSGLSPEQGHRWSVFDFDPGTYRARQNGAAFPPFLAKTNIKSAVFDLPYFDLGRAPDVRGITSWGAHDPGTNRASSPTTLLDEAKEQFGEYPATKWIYGHTWPSSADCEEMGAALVRAVQQRTKISRWLFRDRLPDSELCIVVVSELHSAIEALWHGIDRSHPLNSHPSASAAEKSLLDVYRATDSLIEELASEFTEHELIIFNMHGMGENRSDPQSMLLLPEFLYRSHFGRTFFEEPSDWGKTVNGTPINIDSKGWRIDTPDTRGFVQRIFDFAHRKVPIPFRRFFGLDAWYAWSRPKSAVLWMPAARYQPFWHKMPAFALPSYYDGSIRINLKGRERHGIVPVDSYESECERVVEMLQECRDPNTGEPVVDCVEYNGRSSPLDVHRSQGDIIVVWRNSAVAFEHPKIGRIGPVPFRRTGGHTGRWGFAYIKSSNCPPADYGVRSSFDVAPTLLDMLHRPKLCELGGTSLLKNS